MIRLIALAILVSTAQCGSSQNEDEEDEFPVKTFSTREEAIRRRRGYF